MKLSPQPHAVRRVYFPRDPGVGVRRPTTIRRSVYLNGGVCRRGIYDNMKTAVEAIFVGQGPPYNRRFLQMCSHHLVEPVACTPASGWEEGPGREPVGNLLATSCSGPSRA